MVVAISRIKRLLKKFNKKNYTLEDVLKICQRERITLASYPMEDHVKGYYQTSRKKVYRKRFIVLNEKLPRSEWLEVLLHELVHHFLHVSSNLSRQTFYCRLAHLNDSKNDLEADAIALMMEISEAKLFELMETPMEYITEFTNDKLIRRLEVQRKYGHLLHQ